MIVFTKYWLTGIFRGLSSMSRTQFQIFSWIGWIYLCWLLQRWNYIESTDHAMVSLCYLLLVEHSDIWCWVHYQNNSSELGANMLALTGFNKDRRWLWSKGSSCWTCWKDAQGWLDNQIYMWFCLYPFLFFLEN